MSRATKRGGQDQSGAAAVEFALVMIPLFLILFGIIEFGLAYNRQQGIHAGVREAARVASIGLTYGEAGAALARAVDTVDPADMTMTVTITDSANNPQGTPQTFTPSEAGGPGGEPCDGAPTSERVRVEAAVVDPTKYGISIPFMGGVFEQSFRSQAVFVCEPRSP